MAKVSHIEHERNKAKRAEHNHVDAEHNFVARMGIVPAMGNQNTVGGGSYVAGIDVL